jgi:hypothetical protein
MGFSSAAFNYLCSHSGHLYHPSDPRPQHSNAQLAVSKSCFSASSCPSIWPARDCRTATPAQPRLLRASAPLAVLLETAISREESTHEPEVPEGRFQLF